MTFGWKSLTACCAPVTALLMVAVSRPAHADLARDYVSDALQGDLERARRRFEETPDSALTAAERDLSNRFHDRFVARTETLPDPGDDPFVCDVVRTYREYWTRALMQELSREEGEAFLTKRIAATLEEYGRASPDSAVLDRMGDELERRGWHYLDGVTQPYFDLMLWSSQDSTRYDVVLTDGTQPVDVVFMADFVVKGWSHFATFGRAYTGGWAGDDALYCLREDYDLDSEKFLVSYLKHESRHFADYARFPELQQIDLEYRGKLTELAFARETLADLLRHFAGSAALNEAAPHSFANYCVVRDVARVVFGDESFEGARWRDVDPDVVHRAARELLDSHTAELQAAGADTVRGVLVRSVER